LLDKAANRTKMLQRAIIMLYLALCVFIATSLSLGIMDVFNLLIRESSLARIAINRELNQTLHYFKTNLTMLSKQQKRRWWQPDKKAVTEVEEGA